MWVREHHNKLLHAIFYTQSFKSRYLFYLNSRELIKINKRRVDTPWPYEKPYRPETWYTGSPRPYLKKLFFEKVTLVATSLDEPLRHVYFPHISSIALLVFWNISHPVLEPTLGFSKIWYWDLNGFEDLEPPSFDPSSLKFIL